LTAVGHFDFCRQCDLCYFFLNLRDIVIIGPSEYPMMTIPLNIIITFLLGSAGTSESEAQKTLTPVMERVALK
jgi:hypothetical protein